MTRSSATIPNGSSVTAGAGGGRIFDSHGGQWTVADGRVVINGATDWSTRRVILLAYVDGKMYQENADNRWWSRSLPTDGWTETSAPDLTRSMGTLTMSSSSSLTDPSGNVWSIVDSRIVVNGVVDPTTRNVTDVTYVDGVIWQKNADDNWYGKASPSDSWSAATKQPPIYGVDRVWYGGEGPGAFASDSSWGPASGTPRPGDTATLFYGTVDVDSGFGTLVNFDPEGSTARYQFDHPSGYLVGQLEGSGTIAVGAPGQALANQLTTINASGITTEPGKALTIEEYQRTANVIVGGNSLIGPGSTLTVGQLAINHVPYGNLENDGAMLLDGGSLNVGTLSGSGSVTLTNGSHMFADKQTTETIILQSGHLDVGNPLDRSPTIQFLVSSFGADSSMSISNTQATLAVVVHNGPDAKEMFLVNGTTGVADIRFSGGADTLYASSNASGGVTISAHDSGTAVPIINI